MYRWQKVLLILVVAVALFFIDKGGFFDLGSGLVRRFIIAPTTRTVSGIGEETVFFLKNIFSVRGIIKENLFLKSQRDFFREEYFKLAQVREENEFLRQALDLGSDSQKKLVLSRILSFDPFSAGDSFLIDKGSDDGVKVSDPVVIPGGVVVGKLKEVNKRESKVLLITSAQSKITVFSEGEKVTGVVSGSISGALELDLVLKDVKLESGQILISSGLDGVFPSGLLVGEVINVSESGAVFFKKASVRPFFTSRDLKQVFIFIAR